MEEKNLVDGFSKDMLTKLQARHDRYSPMGWKTLDLKRLLWLLEGEIQEIGRKPYVDEGNAAVAQVNYKMNKGLTRDNAIDIANYAMFIWELNKENDTNREN